MTPKPTQDKSSLSLDTDLGTDALILLEATGREALSAPFELELTAEATGTNVDVTSLLSKSVTVTLKGDEETRDINGRVWAVRQAGVSCQLIIRPWLSLLETASDNRIFQNKTTTDIVSAVFKAAGFSDFKISLTGTARTHEYCVQFGETNFDFVSRLLEADGLGYMFEHEAGRHTMVIFDDSSAFKKLPGSGVPFQPVPAPQSYISDQRIDSLLRHSQVTSGHISLRDYNFTVPDQSLEVTVGDSKALGHYLYPGHHEKTKDGETNATVQLDALKALASGVKGRTPWRQMRSGARFTLKDHPDTSLNTDYFIRAHSFRAARRSYEAEFDAQPVATPWRPLQVTDRPRMAGPQTARVVAASGDELLTDKYGRIKVQFPWDRAGKKDQNSSCWIRVAQSWAGAGWGTVTLPRVGQEVVVSFIDGDPDRPLVTGVVYNGVNMPPYDLPADETKTTLKTSSSKGGSGFNELRFEDKAGSEEVYIHAQKDMKLEIKNDQTETIDHDQTLTVKNDRTVSITEGKDSLTVEKGARTVDVKKGDETYSVGGKRTVTITGKETRENKADFDHTVKGDAKLTVQGSLTIEVQGALKLTGNGVTVSSKQDLTLSATGSLKLSGTSGVTIESQSMFKLSGAAEGKVDGGGMLTLAGGLIKLG